MPLQSNLLQLILKCTQFLAIFQQHFWFVCHQVLRTNVLLPQLLISINIQKYQSLKTPRT